MRGSLTLFCHKLLPPKTLSSWGGPTGLLDPEARKGVPPTTKVPRGRSHAETSDFGGGRLWNIPLIRSWTTCWAGNCGASLESTVNGSYASSAGSKGWGWLPLEWTPMSGNRWLPQTEAECGATLCCLHHLWYFGIPVLYVCLFEDCLASLAIAAASFESPACV